MTLPFTETEIPADGRDLDDAPPTQPTTDFDTAYPGSTPEAPYGFKPDGTPYKRRPRGTASVGTTASAQSSSRSDAMARAAAKLLANGNRMVGLGLLTMGLPETASAIGDANDEFEKLAYEALAMDPALAKKILAGGANSGKAMLFMAYGNLALSIAPAIRIEYKESRDARRAAQLEEAATNG